MTTAIIQRLSWVVNTVILLLVFGLMACFCIWHVTFLVYFSIPTALIYIIGYYLLYKEKLDYYVWMVFMWLTLYMGVTTICLGYGYGFHLYCFSMVPTIFVAEYISYRLKKRSLRALGISIGIAVFYLICTGYAAYFGPVYVREQKVAAFFWLSNALAVFGFLIFYTNYLIRLIISSEEKLREIALVDRLTKLYNRHYMIDHLESLPPDAAPQILAMADIDSFKKINDVYGHNAGDLVLQTVAETMRQECADCVVSRWGGEEFLILSLENTAVCLAMLERLRKTIEAHPVSYEAQQIPVTLTIGMAERKAGQSIDSWTQEADQKLYYGKNSGKNRVVS